MEMGLMGHDLGTEIRDVLGLPEKTIGFTLYCHTGQPVEIECNYLAETEKGELAERLKKYHVVETCEEKNEYGLIPCPECESRNVVLTQNPHVPDSPGFKAKCRSCGKSTMYTSLISAKAIWNQRAFLDE